MGFLPAPTSSGPPVMMVRLQLYAKITLPVLKGNTMPSAATAYGRIPSVGKHLQMVHERKVVAPLATHWSPVMTVLFLPAPTSTTPSVLMVRLPAYVPLRRKMT